MKKIIIILCLMLTLGFLFISCDTEVSKNTDNTQDDVISENSSTSNSESVAESRNDKIFDALAEAATLDNKPYILTETSLTKAVASGPDTYLELNRTKKEVTYFDGSNMKCVTETTTDGQTETETTWWIKTDTGYSMYNMSEDLYIYSELTNDEYAEIEQVVWELHDILIDTKSVTVTENGGETVYSRDVNITGLGEGTQQIFVKDGKISKCELDLTLIMYDEYTKITTTTKGTTTEEIQYTDVTTITAPDNWNFDEALRMDWSAIKQMFTAQ